MDISHGTVLPEEPPVYRLTGVSKIYRKGGREIPAVRDLDLEIRAGEWLAVQGKTGHGKTTLLQILGGLDRPTRGQVEFGGQDLATATEARVRKVRASSFGFIFQTFNLVPTLSAQENVERHLRNPSALWVPVDDIVTAYAKGCASQIGNPLWMRL